MASAKRGKHAKRPSRANRASGLAFAVGLGMAVATGHGVASASTGDGQSDPSANSDTGSKADSTSGSTSGTTTSSTSSSSTSTSGTSETTTSTTTSGDGPTTSVSASGGSGTTTSGSTQTTTEPTTEPTTEKPTPTEKPKPTETGSSTTTPTTETTATPETTSTPETPQATTQTEDKAKSSTTVPAEQTAAKIETIETVSATTENTDSKTEETSPAPAARMVTATTATTTATTPGLPTVTLPPYPTIPGVSPTRVAVAVVIVLGRALQAALSGPVPNPIAIPLYMLVVAAYQRLTEIALNHVPVVTQPTPALQVPIVGTITGTLIATDPDGDPLTFTYTQPTNGGLVVVTNVPLTNQYTYVYTPPLLGGGGANSFTITFDDTGVGDHFYAPNGHTTAYTVNLDVPTAVVGARDSIGVVRGGFAGSAAGRTYSLANGNTAGATATSAFTSLGGIVSLNTTTGDWTYVPAVSGHNILGVPDNTDTFVVTVDDGVNGAVQTTVSVGADLGIAVTGTSTSPTTGAYSGSLNIPAGDNGLLTYSVGSGPSSKGSVFVTSTGGFIYTPTDAARHAAAKLTATDADKTDSFTIKGTDANGRSITVATVQVTISATNADPTGTATFNSPDSNGTITGSVSVTDDDNDTLTYTGTAGKGTVTFNGINFTYTPTLTARHAAAADGASTATKQDTVTINVSDGYGGVKTFTQTVSITSQNTAPTYTSVTKSSSGLLGLTKTWTVNGISDADGDATSIAVTTLPTGGLVNLPVVLGNTVTLVSILAEGGKTFVVTLSDGHGGNVPITLTI